MNIDYLHQSDIVLVFISVILIIMTHSHIQNPLKK